ncbi:GtrA family protein [Aestuariivirga sp.]|uniref:GtrA family protein n=1 Tax=Aestuariivirga sp. TaxID=2650926 RepID=UPI00391B574F
MSRTSLLFLLCGAAAALVNWLARILLSNWLEFRDAVILAFLIGMAAGFLLYRGLVWPGSRTPLLHQLAGFVAVNAASGALVTIAAILLLKLASLVLPASPLVEAGAHAAALALGAVANFAGHSRVTFRHG